MTEQAETISSTVDHNNDSFQKTPLETTTVPPTTTTTATSSTATTTTTSTTTSASSSSSSSLLPRIHLVITNISKRNNVRQLLTVAAAFGCASVLVVGQQSFRTHLEPPDSDDHNNTKNYTDIPTPLLEAFRSGVVQLHRFATWNECLVHLETHQWLLVGVEIHPDAVSLRELWERYVAVGSGRRDIAFLMGNEGQGILPKHQRACDAFCTIPQFGGGTASLNVYVAASIVLQRFYQWKNTNSTLPLQQQQPQQP